MSYCRGVLDTIRWWHYEQEIWRRTVNDPSVNREKIRRWEEEEKASWGYRYYQPRHARPLLDRYIPMPSDYQPRHLKPVEETR